MLSQKMSKEKLIAVIVALAMLLMAPVQSWAGAGGRAKAADNEKEKKGK